LMHVVRVVQGGTSVLMSEHGTKTLGRDDSYASVFVCHCVSPFALLFLCFMQPMMQDVRGRWDMPRVSPGGQRPRHGHRTQIKEILRARYVRRKYFENCGRGFTLFPSLVDTGRYGRVSYRCKPQKPRCPAVIAVVGAGEEGREEARQNGW
jgi:hypothetical protein